MIIPTGLIMVLLLAAFVLTCFQYYRADPQRRVVEPRFAIMAVTAVIAISYPIASGLVQSRPHLAELSYIYLVAALVCLGGSYFLLRRMPPKPH